MDRRIDCWFTRELAAGHIALRWAGDFRVHKRGRVQMTPSVHDVDARLRGRVLYVMSSYNTFDDDSEHDWGVFIFAGYSFERRIEYRDKDGTGTSADPADPDKTFRVLTPYAV
jgi:hypothetical protein